MARDGLRTQPSLRHGGPTPRPTSFVLLRGPQRFPVRPGETVIGRGADADVVVDSPLVSRRHARITLGDSDAYIEDLGSVNGVRVDGELVQGKVPIHPGARLAIADVVFTLVPAASADTTHSTQRVVTQDSADDGPTDSTTRRTHAFQLMAGVVDKALALGKPDEAERLLGSLMAEVLQEAQRGGDVPHEVALTAASVAVKLAAATGKPAWAEYPLRLFLALRAPLPLAVVDELFAVARRVPRVDLALLRRYVELLDGMPLGPSHRFLVQRLHNLARMLGAVSTR